VQLNELKKEMQFTKELLSLIDTLKNIAGARYHVLEREKERFGAFMDAFKGFFKVIHDAEDESPLVRVESDILGIVIATSDSGFMGGLNAGVMRAAVEAQGDLPDDKVQLIVIGDKGAGRLSDAGRDFKGFAGIDDETRYDQAIEMSDYLMTEVLERRLGKVVMVYPKPLSLSQQVVETFTVLPCAELFDRGAEEDEEAHIEAKNLGVRLRKVIIESSYHDMVEYLARTWIVSKFYEVFEDSKLSEYGARAMHLEGSHQKLEKDEKKLQYQYFQAAHEKIDKGMRESYSAGNIRKKKKKAAASKLKQLAEAEL
jgi:ATP synthase F1 gamma subunit